MRTHLHRELERLKRSILYLGAAVEETVALSVRSVKERDPELARRLIDADYEIDKKEVELEEECLKILALHQPVAIDLRFVVAVLKINNELERIADLAVDVAERSAFLATQLPVQQQFDFSLMAEKSRDMLRNALDSLVNTDSQLAHNVIRSDDEVDALNREIMLQVQRLLRERPDDIGPLIHCLLMARHLERMADHATNVAEDVIYMIEGEIVRHKAEDYHQSLPG
jgi:phosphate transport system protein